jgi:BAAT / Acyl-CoA thioester hydrolase C terminal
VALAATAVAAGCVGDEDADRPRAQATPTTTPAPPPAPREMTVRFKATDGESVTAQFAAAGENAPAVVLLHEIRGGPDQWDELIPYLHAEGFATLAYLSRTAVPERERERDVVGAVRWLRSRPEVDDRRLALVGASIGASTAVFAMATGTRRTVDAAVALSPPDSADIWALQDHDRYRPHDMLLVSDERESASADGMLTGAARSKAMRSAGPGHGVALLAEAGVRAALVSWLKERVRR